MKAYYNETVETVRRDLNGEQDFLTNEEVKRRQEKFGFNELAEGKKKSGLQIFLEQYKDFLVLILIVSAVVSLFLGGNRECGGNSGCDYYECYSGNCADH